MPIRHDTCKSLACSIIARRHSTRALTAVMRPVLGGRVQCMLWRNPCAGHLFDASVAQSLKSSPDTAVFLDYMFFDTTCKICLLPSMIQASKSADVDHHSWHCSLQLLLHGQLVA